MCMFLCFKINITTVFKQHMYYKYTNITEKTDLFSLVYWLDSNCHKKYLIRSIHNHYSLTSMETVIGSRKDG